MIVYDKIECGFNEGIGFLVYNETDKSLVFSLTINIDCCVHMKPGKYKQFAGRIKLFGFLL
jgi:hypothetical protein